MTELENMAGTEQEFEQEEQEVDPVAEKLRELEERQAALDKQARDLNKGFMEIAEREKKLTASAAVEDDDEDDIPPLDPAAEKILNSVIDKRVGPVMQAQQELYNETVNSELEAAADKAGLTVEELVETIEQTGLQPRDGSLAAARETIAQAARIAKSQTFDEKQLEQRIREKILKELAEEGVHIEGVKPTRQLPTEVLDTSTMSAEERYHYAKSRQAK